MVFDPRKVTTLPECLIDCKLLVCLSHEQHPTLLNKVSFGFFGGVYDREVYFPESRSLDYLKAICTRFNIHLFDFSPRSVSAVKSIRAYRSVDYSSYLKKTWLFDFFPLSLFNSVSELQFFLSYRGPSMCFYDCRLPLVRRDSACELIPCESSSDVWCCLGALGVC